jgi:hypothetical protein
MKNIRTACIVFALALAAGAQTARLGSLPGDARVVTNTSALQLTQAMLDALNATNAAALAGINATNAAALQAALEMIAAMNATNAALTARILSLTNGWAQYDTLVQQTNATVRLYQSDTELRWAWLTPTNIAVTTLTPVPGTESTNIVWSPPAAVPIADASLQPVSGGRAAVAAAARADGGYMTVRTAVTKGGGAWTTDELAYPVEDFLAGARQAAFHATGGGAVYAGFMSSSNLWRSADGGATWAACAALPPARWYEYGNSEYVYGFYAGYVYSRGATVIAVPRSFTGVRYEGTWYYGDDEPTSTNRWLRSADGGATWAEFEPDVLWRNPSPTQEEGYRDFDMYANAFVDLHETPGGETINLNTWVHQSELIYGGRFHSTNVIRRLDGTAWSDYAALPCHMVNIRAAGGLYFGSPYAGYKNSVTPGTAVPRVSADLAAWQETDLPARNPLDPYSFFASGGMWAAQQGTNLWLSADGVSWLPADRPEDAPGGVHPCAGRLYIGAGASRVRTGAPGLVMDYTSETVAVPLWGDWQADVAAAVAGMATTQQVAAASNALAQAADAHAAQRNPHRTTAADVGAITNEQDLAALRTYHYGSPDIVESPEEWFGFDGAGTITAFNWEAGRTNVVIPWEIGGVPVTAIGRDVFRASAVVSLIAPQTVTSIEVLVFYDCTSLASVSLPQAQTIGIYAFSDCTSLASVSLPQADY